MPAGCAHGFQAPAPTSADVSYMIDRAHDPNEDVSIAFDDPDLAIRWPFPVTTMSSRTGSLRRWLTQRDCWRRAAQQAR